MATLINNVERHHVHKFRDIRPKLNNDNWVSWKRELLATARDRGLYRIIVGQEPKPVPEAAPSASTAAPETGPSTHVPSAQVVIAPTAEVTKAWAEKNDTAYNQILLTISNELQSLLDDTDEAASAWQILCNKFESTDPSKISVVRAKYDNYHMVEGQTVSNYISNLKEMRDQLRKMGDPISDVTHGSTILRNLPESWQPIASMIRIVTYDPETVRTKLEAHEASLLALQINEKPAAAFAAHKRDNCKGTTLFSSIFCYFTRLHIFSWHRLYLYMLTEVPGSLGPFLFGIPLPGMLYL